MQALIKMMESTTLDVGSEVVEFVEMFPEDSATTVGELEYGDRERLVDVFKAIVQSRADVRGIRDSERMRMSPLAGWIERQIVLDPAMGTLSVGDVQLSFDGDLHLAKK